MTIAYLPISPYFVSAVSPGPGVGTRAVGIHFCPAGEQFLLLLGLAGKDVGKRQLVDGRRQVRIALERLGEERDLLLCQLAGSADLRVFGIGQVLPAQYHDGRVVRGRSRSPA